MTQLKYNIQLHPQLIHLLEAEVLQQSNSKVTMLGYPVYIQSTLSIAMGCISWSGVSCLVDHAMYMKAIVHGQ